MIRHVQLNVQQTMPAHKRVEDVATAFRQGTDTLVFNEVNAGTAAAINREARARGYGVYRPTGSAGQVVLCWRLSRFRLAGKGATAKALAMKGRAKVSPHRYVVRARLIDNDTGRRVSLVGTHMVSSGWTGPKYLDRWRRVGWSQHVRVMRSVLSRANRWGDLTIWSGDLNRPDPGAVADVFTFPNLATSMVVRTGNTHGGVRFDYVGVCARRLRLVASARTVRVNSDHRAVVVRITGEG